MDSRELGASPFPSNSRVEALARIVPKEWDSAFFGRMIGRLEFVPGIASRLESSPREVNHGLDEALRWSDSRGYKLLECSCDIHDLRVIPLLEERGFRLVDTRVTFTSLVERQNTERVAPERGEFRFFHVSDLPGVQRLTRQGFTENSSFFSRFKDSNYFSREETARYFEAWIQNSATEENTWFLVWKDGDEVVGYYILKRIGELGGKPLLKGILAAVDSRYQGAHALTKMQWAIFEYIEEPSFFVENATQLTNNPAIRNHIRSARDFRGIALFFFRSIDYRTPR